MSRRYELGVGCLLLAALVVLGFMALQVGAFSALGRNREVYAVFPDAAGLSDGAVVAIAGVRVGEVTDLSLVGGAPRVTLRLNRDAPVQKDDRVMIRARSVLGEKYVEVVPSPGEAPLAERGDVLLAAGDTTEIDELVNTLGPLLRSLDPEVVRRAGEALSRALEEDPDRLARMLENADRMLSNGAAATDELPALTREGRAAVADVRRTLEQTRGTLSAVERRAEEAEDILAHADRLISQYEAAGEPVPELLAELKLAISDARGVVGLLDEDAREDLRTVLANMSEIDKWELRRLLREEGVVIRLRSAEVDPAAGPEYRPRGKVKER